ncbi:SpoIIE family protein phosphatase [Streptomyces sp. NBC_01136]|nr:SpoIIE family protein phosphatase [Streptomyces sp. NBC_01136]
MPGESRHAQDAPGVDGAPDGVPAQAPPSFLSAHSAGSNAYDLLRFGLDRAMAVVQALGGMVHLGAPGSSSLYLAVEGGLEGATARHWEEVDRGSPEAPAYAVRTNVPAWTATTSPGLAASSSGLPAGAGLLSVPIPAPDEPLGALSVFTRIPEEPALHQQLRAVAGWIPDCLRGSPGHPELEDAGRPDVCAGPDSSLGFWGWDFRTGTVIWDGAALDILGIDAKGFDGQIRTWRRLVHPQDLPQVLVRADEAIRARTPYQMEFRVRQPDGTLRRVEVRGQASSLDDGSGPRLTGIVRGPTTGHLAEGSAEQALRRMRDGFLAVDHTWRITFANPEAERLLTPSRQLLGHELWEAVPALRTLGVQEAGRQAAAEDRPTELDIRSDTGRWLHVRLVPLPDGLALCITDISSTRRQEAKEAAAEGAAVERTTRIAKLTQALAAAVTGHDVADVLGTHMLPLFGAKGVGVWVHENGQAFLVGSVGYSQESLRRFEGARIADLPTSAQAFIEGTPNFISSAEEFITHYPGIADLPAESGVQAWAILPLIASGRTVGAACVVYDRPHTFSSEERTLLTALSGMVAQAMERARLYDAEHRRAQELQRGLLPRTLPALPAVTTAARYQPTGDGMDVGGDWYDVIPLSAEQVALVIGDVMGHGLSEAVTMGRLRTAVRTLADLEQPLDEMFFHLNEVVSGLGDDFYATCLCIVYDPASRLCRGITAGHPPPVVLRPDGTAYFPDLPVNSPLGVAEPPFDTAEFSLPDGTLLALYTDGLVESGGWDIDEGMGRLARHLHPDHPGSAHPPAPEALDDLCDRLINTLLPDRRSIRDDSALLVARTHALAPEDISCRQLQDDPTAAGQARAHVRDQLTTWSLDELIMTTELVVSELVGNVVRHARGPITLRLLRGRTLVCEVTDGSPTMPRIRRAADTDESGRGLQLIAALTSRWGARYTASGKCIWTEQHLPTDPPW